MGYLDCDILIISRIVKIKVKIKKVLKFQKKERQPRLKVEGHDLAELH